MTSTRGEDGLITIMGRGRYLEVLRSSIQGVEYERISAARAKKSVVRLYMRGGVFDYCAESDFFARGLARLFRRVWKDSEMCEVQLPDLYPDRVNLGKEGCLYVSEGAREYFEGMLDKSRSLHDRVQSFWNLYEGGTDMAGVRIPRVRYEDPVIEVAEAPEMDCAYHLGEVLGWLSPGQYVTSHYSVVKSFNEVCENRDKERYSEEEK